MQFAYTFFSQQPDAAQLTASPGASLWYLLDGDLRISAQQHRLELPPNFPLFRVAALLQHWLAYRPAPLDESRLHLAEYELPAALIIRRQPRGIRLIWEADGQAVSQLVALEVEFNRASAAFLEQLRADVQQQLGVDIRPHLKGIPF